jgi:hypothetical protein
LKCRAAEGNCPPARAGDCWACGKAARRPRWIRGPVPGPECAVFSAERRHLGAATPPLNQKLTAWWDQDFASLRAELKKVYKRDIPLAERVGVRAVRFDAPVSCEAGAVLGSGIISL